MSKTLHGVTATHKPLVSDLSYDLVTILKHKLEAVAAYEQYIADCQKAGNEECLKILTELKRDDERHVTHLKTQLVQMVKAGTFN